MGWITDLIICGVCIVIFFSLMLGCVILKYEYDDNKKEACIEEYGYSYFDYSIEQDCGRLICEEMGLHLSTSGTWTKPLVYCETEFGGLIKVEMPYYGENETCQDYFKYRWDNVLCLYRAGYIEELT